MKPYMKALLVSGGAMILASGMSWAGASLDDLIGGIAKDNESMGMNVHPSTAPVNPSHNHHHDDESDRFSQPGGLPVLVTNPSVIQPEAVSSIATTSPLNPPDVNGMLADFHVRLAEDKDLLSRQFIKGGITQDQYDGDRKALEDLADLERGETVGGNGSLSADQVVDLSKRMEEIHKKIMQDLAS